MMLGLWVVGITLTGGASVWLCHAAWNSIKRDYFPALIENGNEHLIEEETMLKRMEISHRQKNLLTAKYIEDFYRNLGIKHNSNRGSYEHNPYIEKVIPNYFSIPLHEDEEEVKAAPDNSFALSSNPISKESVAQENAVVVYTPTVGEGQPQNGFLSFLTEKAESARQWFKPLWLPIALYFEPDILASPPLIPQGNHIEEPNKEEKQKAIEERNAKARAQYEAREKAFLEQLRKYDEDREKFREKQERYKQQYEEVEQEIAKLDAEMALDDARLERLGKSNADLRRTVEEVSEGFAKTAAGIQEVEREVRKLSLNTATLKEEISEVSLNTTHLETRVLLCESFSQALPSVGGNAFTAASSQAIHRSNAFRPHSARSNNPPTSAHDNLSSYTDRVLFRRSHSNDAEQGRSREQ